MLYSIVVSAVWQSESVITSTSSFLDPSHLGHHRALSRVS